MSKILIKRSAVPGKVPDKLMLDPGEIALNTYDGRMYLRRGSDDTIVEIGNVTEYLGFTPANVAGDTLTGTLVLKPGANSNPPLKFQQGTLSTVTIPHALEWDGANLYITNNGSARRQLAYMDSNITGKAGGWTTARTLTLNGDLSSTTMTIDGSANVTGTLTLNSINPNVGTFGDAKTVPAITVNSKGLVTAVKGIPIALAVTDVSGAAPLLNPTFNSADAVTPTVTINTPSTTTAVAGLILNATQSSTGRNIFAFHAGGTRYGSLEANSDGIMKFVSASRKYSFGDGSSSTATMLQHVGATFATLTGVTVDFANAPTINGQPISTAGGSITGNAATATKLQTPRLINGTAFDGSQDISFTTDSVVEGTTNLYFTTARAAIAAPVQSVNGKAGAVTLAITDLGGVLSVSQGGTGTNSLNGYVFGTGTGALTAVTTIPGSAITGDFAGNAATANKLKNSTTINGLPFDGSSALTITTDNVTEGNTNLYYLDTRARAAFSATGSLSYNATTGVFSFTDAVTSVAGKKGAVTLAVTDITGAAPLASPAFTGTPTAPTASSADNSTTVATTAFVRNAINDGVSTSGTMTVQTTSLTTSKMNITGTSTVTIDTFDPTVYRTSRFLVQIFEQAGSMHSCEILLVQDDVNVMMTIYGSIASAGDLGTFDAVKTSSAIELHFTPITASAKSITVFRTSLTG